MEPVSAVKAEQPSGREVRRPYWLISIPAAGCRDEMEGLVFPTIEDDADDEAQQQTKRITYLAKLRELAMPHRGDVRDTRSTSFLHRTTPTEEKSALQPSGALFGSRCEPTHGAHVIAVFDLKPGREPFSQADVAQVVTYCKHLLAVEQPGRSEATSFLLNAANVVFVRVKCSGKPSHNCSFTYEFTPAGSVVPSGADTGVGASLPPIGVQWLYQFFSSSHNSHLGMEVVNNPFEKTFVHSTLLGRGTMGRVYSVIGHDDKVIKLVGYISKTNEAEVLRQLEQVNVPHVPRVLEAASTSLLLSPRAADLKPGQFGLRHALQALDTLQATHEKTGLVHRDIQPANLLLLATHHHDHRDGHPDTRLGDQGDILVNDWGSATPANQLRPYAGTFTHASDTVLRHIAEGKERFPVGPADDLVSLVRTTFTLVSPHASDSGRTKCSLAVAARRLIDRWASALSQEDGKWAELQAAAESCDYDAVRRGLQELAGP